MPIMRSLNLKVKDLKNRNKKIKSFTLGNLFAELADLMSTVYSLENHNGWPVILEKNSNEYLNISINKTKGLSGITSLVPSTK